MDARIRHAAIYTDNHESMARFYKTMGKYAISDPDGVLRDLL